MKRARFGLQGHFLLVSAVALSMVLAIVVLLLQRQSALQRETDKASRDVIHELYEQSLRDRGQSLAKMLADALRNPVYYADLDEIGSIVRGVRGQDNIGYVLVYDDHGRLVSDGSLDIPGYGMRMEDPLAAGAISATGMKVQRSYEYYDVSMPIMIGNQHIGGVRVGIRLAEIRSYEDRTSARMHAQLAKVGQRHLGLVAALLALLCGVAVLVVWYVQRMLVRPMRWLAESAQRIEKGDYAVGQIEEHRQDELGDLMRAFERMRASIERHDREIRHLAYTDPLTGLPNRVAFRERLDHWLMLCEDSRLQMALLFIDIDDFKRVNDTLGHEAGDEVLLQFANRIGGAVRSVAGDGVMVARLGGDEFVILVQGTDLRELATQLSTRLVTDLGRPLAVQDRQVFLGASIGVTLFPDDASGATALLKNGDIAMYQAKVAGKNCYRFYSRAMNHAVERRAQLEEELRGAWDRGEMSLVYQPIFSADSGLLAGAEALLRWNHPVLGTVAPSVFIDVAEQSGLIESIGPNVLREACREAAGWPTPAGMPPLFISVNVSPRQLRRGDLVDIVGDCLGQSGLRASQLHLELTETAVIDDELQASSLLARLHGTGVKVWLDDFGTGFSGLSYLKRVPVDGVKIDRSFVVDLPRDPDDLALTTAIISMAHSLGITVVAEGIEKREQYELLRERECDLMQGYWMSYPLTAGEFAALLAQPPRNIAG